MRFLLQTRPLGVPLHLSAAHLVFAFVFASVLLDLVAWLGLGVRDTTGTNAAAYALLVLAVIVTVLAALAALASALDMPDEIRSLGWWYVGALALVVLLEIAGLALRAPLLREQAVPPGPLFVSLVALIIAGAALFFGGQFAARELEEEFEEELEEPEPIRRRRRR